MATVRITNTLRGYILTSVSNMFNPRLKKLHDELTQNTFVARDVYNFLVPTDHQKLLLSVPNVYLSKRKDFAIMWGESYSQRMTLSLPGDPRPCPVNWSNTHIRVPLDTPGVAKAIGLQDQMAELTRERDALTHSLEAMLSQCSTIAQVEKIWPSITQHLDGESLMKHNAPTVKRDKLDVESLLTEETKVNLAKAMLHAAAGTAAQTA